MKRILNLALTLVLLMTLVPKTRVSAAPDGGGNEPGYATGLIWDSWETIEAHLQEDTPLAFKNTLPPSVDLTSEFPAPGNQGRQNSCVPWAVAYALRSHQEEVKRDWGLTVDSHLFSPGYVYNQINGGADNGSNFSYALSILVEQGVSTLASFPYNQFDYFTKPTEAHKAEAIQYRIAEYYTIRGRDSIKRRLADGDGIVVGMSIYPDFDNLNQSNPIFDVINGESRGNHAICLIGYDDDLSAFKFINSWGTGWGVGGYGWISYDLMEDERVNNYGVAAGYVMEALDASLFTEGFFEYTVSGGEATLVRYLGSDANVVIPDTLGGYPVRSIGGFAFQNKKSLTGVVIPGSVTSIGRQAFTGCSLLTDVTIPDGVTEISSGMFYNCRSLSNIVIPDGVVSIGGSAFSGTKLASIDIPGSVTAIGGSAFYDTGLTSVVIPGTVTSIGDFAFTYCSYLTNVIIGNGVVSIGKEAFSSCNKLTGVLIPDSVTSIGSGVFSGCYSLTGISVGANNPNYVSENGVLFDKNKTLLLQYPAGKTGTSYIIPNGVTVIGDNAFTNCSRLTDVVIPYGVTYIGVFAFFGPNLTSINIPDSVTTIAWGAFAATRPESLVIPDSVTTIEGYAFSNCSELTSVVIGKGVTSIEGYAFNNCKALTSVLIPENVTFIGSGAFHYSTWGGEAPLPNLTIHCYKNSYAHNYAVKNGIPILIEFKGETKIIEVSKLRNTENITVNHIKATNTTDGFYNLAVDFEKAGEVFFILAVYEGDMLIKTYLSDDGAEIKGIAESDLAKGKIYIWDKKNMQPCIEVIRLSALNQA